MADFIFNVGIPVAGLFWTCFIFYSLYLCIKYKVLVPWTEANKKESLVNNVLISGFLVSAGLIILYTVLGG